MWDIGIEGISNNLTCITVEEAMMCGSSRMFVLQNGFGNGL